MRNIALFFEETVYNQALITPPDPIWLKIFGVAIIVYLIYKYSNGGKTK